ncbi:hypothetical protein [Paeniglutamicibacter gangotriensis]|uniref:Uncharacterized protein n=1 Tax=Paeniglutamicibacter gangotriensis Lz1y TaxID=1276920 RepID=M7MQY8_9MICC|nr:hypothetical protein [Paeniglutamicibacter gangotriensis]EMQ97335.1 hypothetical protein ADIAG_03130 [Paeniglutamicibacter gangotriensis Lz1y]
MKSFRTILSAISVMALLAAGTVPAANAAFETSCTQTVFDNTEYGWVEDPTILKCFFVESLDDIVIPDSVTNLSLDSKSTDVSIHNLEKLASYPSLREVTVWSRSASQKAIEGLSKLPKVEKIELEFPYGADADIDATPLTAAKSLTSLQLVNAGIRDFQWVNQLPNLKSLHIDGGLQHAGLPLAGKPFSFDPVVGVDGKSIKPKNGFDSHFRPLDDFSGITEVSAVPARPGQSSLVFQSALSGSHPSLSSVYIDMHLGVNVSDKPAFRPMELTYKTIGGSPVLLPGDHVAAATSPLYGYGNFQWKRNGVPISGATTQWYALTSADIGKIISVTYTREAKMSWDGKITIVPRETGTVAYDYPIPASAAKAPKATVGGSVNLAETATADLDPKFFPSAKRTYQWFMNGELIKGATKSNYKVPDAKYGAWINVQIQVSGSYPALFESEQKRITQGALKATKPSIIGTPKVGSKLTASPGRVDQAGSSLMLIWERNGKAIPQQNGKTYTLTSADLGKKITVRAQYERPPYVGTAPVSSATKAVAPGTMTVSKKPAISGKKIAGKTIKVSGGTYTPKATKVTYQWQRAGKNIKGATKSSYKVVKTDKGKKLTVKVTAKKTAYTDKLTILTAK